MFCTGCSHSERTGGEMKIEIGLGPYQLPFHKVASQVTEMVKKSIYNAGDLGLTLGSG